MIWSIIVPVGATFVAFLGSIVYLLDKRYRLPPGPMPLPFIGNFASLGKKMAEPKKKMWKVMREYAETYGPIFTLYFGQYRMVGLNDSAIIHEALVNQSKTFSWRQDTDMPGFEHMPVGIIGANYDTWRRRRRFGLKAMRDFGMGKELITVNIQDEAGHLLAEFRKLEETPFKPKQLLTNAVSNVICSFVFGKRFEFDDAEFHKLLHAIDALVRQNPDENLAFLSFPFLKHLREPRQAKRFIAVQTFVHELVKKTIEERRSDFNAENIRDFPDLFILEELQPDGIDIDSFVNIMADFFVAGTETTSTALTWTLLYLTNFPEVQKKCHENIDYVIDTDRMPTLRDRPHLFYIEALMHEIFRHASIVSQSLFHSNRETFAKLAGYDIPPFTLIMYNTSSLHHDTSYWKDPEAFRPERWISEDGTKLLSHSTHFMPFGLGPRICLGESLARVEYFIFIVALLQRYQFKLKSPVSIDDGVQGVIHTPPDFEIIAQSR